MAQGMPLDRLTSAMARAQRRWRELSEARDQTERESPELTIALEREAGAPGTSIAHEVGTRLGWLVYDHELLERIAQELGLRVSLLESMDERRQSWLRESVEAFAHSLRISEAGYVRHLVETLLSLAAHGQCVIVGRGGAQILPLETTLRVRVVGLRDDRVAATSQRLGISRVEAAHWVDEKERERTRFIRDHFLKDPSDAHHYDLILNTSRWSVAECADLIVDALRRRQNSVATAELPQAAHAL